MDQVVGASGEELTFTIYWLVWPILISASISSITYWNAQYEQPALFGLSALLFITAFSLVQYFNYLLVTVSHTSNPIKLVVQVLNYARKHKFP